MGSYNRVLSHQGMNIIAPQGLDADHAYLVAEAPGWAD
jgi:hypothetical protein